MTNWECARYLIDAKKCVDSIMYIAQNVHALRNINLREKVAEKRRIFFINCCVVLDDLFPKNKKKLCSTDPIVKDFYYERDKNAAHKDKDYKSKEHVELDDMVSEMQKHILHVRKICASGLPDVMTLDFVPHDRELYRLVEGLTAEQEEQVNNSKYLLKEVQGDVPGGIIKKAFSDTEDIRQIPNFEASDYAVPVENGINTYEGLQNRQDACVKVNVLFNQNMWCQPNYEARDKLERLREIGVIDKHDIIRMPSLDDVNGIKNLERVVRELENEAKHDETKKQKKSK